MTVIVPVFNGQDYLEACLKSIVQQTYKHLEVLVVDDGSTDQTRDIAAGFACRDCRVTVIGISNSGVSVARNTGVRRASGEYIVFVDSDDLLHPGSISHLVTIGEKSELGTAAHFGDRLVRQLVRPAGS